MNGIGRARRFPGLVGLQVADQMPLQPTIGLLRNFLQGFLDLVFAEIPLSRVSRRAHSIDGMGLGNGDQANVIWRSPRSAGRVRDAFANARQPLRDFFVHRLLLFVICYFFSCAIIPFAWVAY